MKYLPSSDIAAIVQDLALLPEFTLEFLLEADNEIDQIPQDETLHIRVGAPALRHLYHHTQNLGVKQILGSLLESYKEGRPESLRRQWAEEAARAAQTYAPEPSEEQKETLRHEWLTSEDEQDRFS